MSAFELTEPKLICPTSGPLLRAGAHAFRLMQDRADSPETALVGSSAAQRSDSHHYRRHLRDLGRL